MCVCFYVGRIGKRGAIFLPLVFFATSRDSGSRVSLPPPVVSRPRVPPAFRVSSLFFRRLTWNSPLAVVRGERVISACTRHDWVGSESFTPFSRGTSVRGTRVYIRAHKYSGTDVHSKHSQYRIRCSGLLLSPNRLASRCLEYWYDGNVLRKIHYGTRARAKLYMVSTCVSVIHTHCGFHELRQNDVCSFERRGSREAT